MIVLDTSVLSLAFRRRPPAVPEPPPVTLLRRLIEEDLPFLVPAIVLQELLSGVREPEAFQRLFRLTEGLPVLLATREHHLAAARMANACRAAGVAAATVDCLIAAMTVDSGARLLTLDADFTRMAPHCGLELCLV